jgi:hypothetical protein
MPSPFFFSVSKKCLILREFRRTLFRHIWWIERQDDHQRVVDRASG